MIDESGIQVDYGDAQIDVSHRFEYAVFDRSTPTYVTGTRITFFVPFSGDPQLFKCRPSTFNLNPPRGLVRGSELVFVYDRTRQDVANIESEFERERQNVKSCLSWIANEVGQFNSMIRQKASEQIGVRREKLLQDRGIVENLGFPLKRRSGVPMTYTSPEVRRRIVPKLPPVTPHPYSPEPTLDMSEYEHILSVISNMVLVMERSPSAFKDMGEEHLRQHFLVQLNGQYEGLGYTCWRDTKTALLIFNRDTTMSTVLQRVPQVVREHHNYKADLEHTSETGFRYVFGHREDSDRELTLTVLVFDIPG